MVNRVTLIGHLGRDPEIRRLENGTPVGKFSIATGESYKDTNGEWQTLTEWHEIVVWRALAEQAERQLKKGALVYLEGKITHRKYTDKNGIDRTITEIVAYSFRPLEKRESSNYFPSQEPPALASRPAQIAAPTQPTPTPTVQTQPVDFQIVPSPEMADAPNSEGGNDLPF